MPAEHAMAPPVLEIHDLHFAWPGQAELLHIPQLSLHQGERVFLEGPSGSGKSTLLGLVGGVHMPDRGHVRLLGRDPLPEDWKDDLSSGLEVIESRSDALGRFMSAYSRLAKMPEPVPSPVDVGELLRGIATLETRVAGAHHLGLLPRGRVSRAQQQTQEDEVSQDRGAAVADEGERDAGEGDEPRDATDDDERLQREDPDESGGGEGGHVVCGRVQIVVPYWETRASWL